MVAKKNTDETKVKICKMDRSDIPIGVLGVERTVIGKT